MLHVTQVFFFLNDTAPPDIYTLSLHDALPISRLHRRVAPVLGLMEMNPLGLNAEVPAGGHRVPRIEREIEKRLFKLSLINGSEEHTSELQSPCNLVCRLLLDKKE